MSEHMRAFVEALKILALCVLAAIVYGILHDAVTIHICPEYFTVYHPPVIRSHNLWVLALGWGTIATWWMGYFLGAPIACAAVLGPKPRLGWRDVLWPLLLALLGCYILAATFGYLAYRSPVSFVTPLTEMIIPGLEVQPDFLARDPNFMAVYVAHNVSYDAGTAAGILVTALLIHLRIRRKRAMQPDS